MVDITILELNLEGSDFTANAPGSGQSGSKSKGGLLSGSDDKESGGGESGDGSSPLPLVVGVVVLVLAAVAVRRLLGGKAEPVPA